MDIPREYLEEYLGILGVPLARWGKGGVKSLDHLTEEMNKGECRINGIVRTTRTAVCRVFYERLELEEICQVFADGSIRYRKLPWGSVGEKLSMRENALSGIGRGFKEELGIILPAFHFNYKGGVTLPLKPSTSYPGLVTVNQQARFVVTMPENFFREQYIEHQDDKSTYFEWRSRTFVRKAS